MANRTHVEARNVHGTNPQFLVEKITRERIYNSVFWKEQCFALTAELLVDKAIELTHYGGAVGGMKRPTPFLCLILKMLQIQPDKEIVAEFIKREEYKYCRILGAFYLRLVGSPLDIYQYLEPLYYDYRRIKLKTDTGFVTKHVDEFVDELLHGDFCCDIVLPRIPKRITLEESGHLEPRVSVLEDDLDVSSDDEEADGAVPDYRERRRSPAGEDRRRDDRRAPDLDDNHRDGGGDAHPDDRDRDRDRRRDKERRGSRDRDDRRGSRDREDRRSRERDRGRRSSRERSRRDHDRGDRDRGDRDRDRDRERRGRSRDRGGRDRRDRDRKSRSRSKERRSRRDDDSDEERRRRKRKRKREDDGEEEDKETREIREANELRASLGLKPLRS